MPRFRQFSIDCVGAFAFMSLLIMALALTGCDVPAWIKAHPQVVKDVEDVAEAAAEAGVKAAEADVE